MFDRLKETDRTIELFAGLGVLDSGLELPFARAAKIGGDRRQDGGPGATKHSFSVLTNDVFSRDRDTFESEGGLIPCQVMDVVLCGDEGKGEVIVSNRWRAAAISSRGATAEILRLTSSSCVSLPVYGSN